MAKRNKDLNRDPDVPASLTAAVLVASAALSVLIAYKLLGSARKDMEESFYLFAAMAFALLWILTERVLKRTVFGVTLTTAWQDRLTFAIPIGFAASIYMIPGVTGTWAIATQLIGGWIIVGCGAVLLGLVWSGIKASFPSSKINTQPKF